LAFLRVLEPAIDTASEGGTHFAFHLKAIANLSRPLIARIGAGRQRAGIEKRKAAGGYPGRKSSVPVEHIRSLPPKACLASRSRCSSGSGGAVSIGR
jgi:DNA invertase Pin-like site-specific DNA recombinase